MTTCFFRHSLTAWAGAATAVVLIAFPAASRAEPVTFSSVSLLGYNAVPGGEFDYYGAGLVPGANAIDGGVATLAGTRDFSGLNETGDADVMTLNYSGSAQGTASSLKAAVSATLTNPFYNPANAPFVIDEDFNTNPNGLPINIGLEARAGLTDSLTITGAADLAYVTFSIDIDGNIDGGYTQVYQHATPSSAFQLLYNEGAPGDHDVRVSSLAFDIIDGKVDINFVLTTVVELSLEFLGGEEELSGSVDFFNTASLGLITGYDASGRQVDVSGATGSGGFQFATARVDDPAGTIPEPAVIALFGVGLAGLGVFTRRRA